MEREWKTIIEPYRAKMVEPLAFTTRAERERALDEADWNLFQVPADHVLIDLLTDSGTSAMSADQWSAMFKGDESYAGASSFYRLERAVRDLTGLKHVLPVHQGRAAERILARVAAGAGKVFLSNSHFDTTRANIESVGATAVDLPVPDALVFETPSPFKGDIDLHALEANVRAVGPKAVAMIVMTLTNNSVGGQPAAMANLRAARDISLHYKIPLFLDAARFAENCWLIKIRERGFSRSAPIEIAREIFALCDGCWISAKKDAFASIGGFLALNDDALAQACRDEMVVGEGFSTYGGLAGRDLEAVAAGLAEALDEKYLAHRWRMINILGDGLRRAGVPFVEPPGGHAVCVNARRLLPHIAADNFPALALAAELFLTSGVRASAAPRELLRLAIPRRAYTQSHLEFVVEVLADVAARASDIRGLRRLEGSENASPLSARMAPLGRVVPLGAPASGRVG